MYHFAICDDEQGDRNKTYAFLEQYRRSRKTCDFSIDSFSSVQELYHKISSGMRYQLLLLDIYMPNKTGIEVARELRNRGYECLIIFLTTSKEHAVEAFNVDAVQYLIKPIEQARFFTIMDNVVVRIRKEYEGYLALRTNGEIRRVAIRNIMYSESQNHYQRVHLENHEVLQIRMTLAEFYDKVREYYDLVRVGSTFVVNLNYVDSLNAKTMKLTNGKELWLPRGSYSLLKEQYFAFYLSGRGDHI